MAEKYFAQPSGTNAQTHFSSVPAAEIERSTFDRSHGYKTTFDAGEIIPCYVDEILPGDTFHLQSTAFARLSTPLKPVMDNIFLDTHYFFVPYRLVWNSWEKFCGERLNPDDDPTVLTVPQATGINPSSTPRWGLVNRMGLPIMAAVTSPALSVSALPFRAYVLIYDEWYRDQNLIPSRITPAILGDGPDTFWNDFACLKRAKRPDYFTSCLPWPQKGDPVYIPLGTSAPVKTNLQNPKILHNAGTERSMTLSNTGGASIVGYSGAVVNPAQNMLWGSQTGMFADLTAATAISINDLRTAFQIQRLLERDARGGTRYIELILSHFGVHSDDGRLQRPEYLGGSTASINFNPIAATFTAGAVAQGQLAAYATGVGKAGFTKSFTEHGVVIGMVSARADLTYQQGVERFWSRKTRYDFYWPALAHLGEQAVLNKEIFYSGVPATDDGVFGYQERYAEYRYKPSRVTGIFGSEYPTSLDVWHLAQDFATLPALNGVFIEENPPIARILAVPTEPHFLLDMWFSLQCTRPMPVYSVPGLIDHF